MSDDENKYIDIVIRNTEILSEFTSLVKRIEILVDDLPNNKDYTKHHEDLNYIKESFSELLVLFKTNAQIINSNDKKIDQIPLIYKAIENIQENTKNTDKYLKLIYNCISKIKLTLISLNVWAKIRLPFIIGFITLVIYAIGFYIQISKYPIIE